MVQGDHEELVEYDMQGDTFAWLLIWIGVLQRLFTLSTLHALLRPHRKGAFCDGDEASARRQEHRLVLAQKDVHLADGICRPLIRARFAKRISSLCYTIRINARKGENNERNKENN